MKEKIKRGPKPDRLKIDGNWIDAVKRALKKKSPKGGESGWDDDNPGPDKPSDGEK